MDINTLSIYLFFPLSSSLETITYASEADAITFVRVMEV